MSCMLELRACPFKMGFDSMAAWDRTALEFNSHIKRRGAYDSATAFDSPIPSPISPIDLGAPSFQFATSRWSPPSSPTGSQPQSRHNSPSTSPSHTPSHQSCAKLSAKERNSLASQLYAASCAGDLQHISLLLSLGAPVNAGTLVKHLYEAFKPAKHGHLSPLVGAATHGQLEAALLLLSHGAELNPDISRSSSAPLHQACRANDLRMAHFLLKAGADVNQQNTYKATPIMYAARHGSLELVHLVLSYSPDLNIRSMVGTSVIHWAMLPYRAESPAIIELLLQAGADANIRLTDEGTPLHYACQSGLPEVVEVLLRYGGDARAKNGEWKTALDLARAVGSDACARLVEKAERKQWRN